MSIPKDSNDYGPRSTDNERDLGAKGGPTTSAGIPDDKHGISKPFEEDLQAQKTAKNKSKKNKEEKENKK